MGKVRDKAYSFKCGSCGADGDSPCHHRVTGKELKGFHRSRCWEAREDIVDTQVKQIERQSSEEFWRFCWEALGLNPHKYPGDKPLVFEPDQEELYFGDW